MDQTLTNLSILWDGIPQSLQHRQSLRYFAWITGTFLSYCIGYNSVNKISRVFFINEAIPKINQFRFVNAIWRVFFSAWVVLFFTVSSLSAESNKNYRDILVQAATVSECNATTFKFREENSLQITLLIAPVSYFLHQLYISVTSRIFEPAVISIGSLAVFVFSTNSAQCAYLCLQILLFLALNVGSMELARAVYALKSRRRGFDGPPVPTLLQVVAIPLFLLHVLVWTTVNFYLFPMLYLSLPSATESGLPSRSATAYINVFLIFFAKQQFFNSPTWSLLKLVVRRPSGRRMLPSFKAIPAIVLLPYTSSLLPELRNIQMNFLQNALPTSAERRMMRKKILSSGSQTSTPISEGTADLMSIVRSVQQLKRKMRRMLHEQRTAKEATALEDEELSNEMPTQDLVGASQDQDVTDIYYPVPAFKSSVESEDEKDKASTSESSLEQSTSAVSSEDRKTELHGDDTNEGDNQISGTENEDGLQPDSSEESDYSIESDESS